MVAIVRNWLTATTLPDSRWRALSIGRQGDAGSAALQKCLELRGADRSGEKESLRMVTPRTGQQVALCRRFDALGDDADAEPVSHHDDGFG